jgi:hypothetical protein
VSVEPDEENTPLAPHTDDALAIAEPPATINTNPSSAAIAAMPEIATDLRNMTPPLVERASGRVP